MELSAIQIVTTVALFCDYLRNRSQQLEELALEFNVRKEFSVAAPAMAPAAATNAAGRNARIRAAREEKVEAAPAPPAEVSAAPAETKINRAERHSTEMVKPALANAAELTSVRGAARPRRRPVPPADVPLPRLDDMNPRQALADWLDQRAAKTPAKHAEPERLEEFVVNPAPRPVPVRIIEEPAPVAHVEEPAPAAHIEEPAPEPVVVAQPVAVAQPVVVAPVEEPVLAIAIPVVEEPVVVTPDIREVLRRALAKRNAPAKAAEPVQFVVADPEPEPESVIEPVTVTALEPVFEPEVEPVPAPVVVPVVEAPRKTVSVFLSTRKLDTLHHKILAEPTPAVPEPLAEQVVEALVEDMAAAEPRFEIIDGAGATSNFVELVLPPGMHDHAFLDHAISRGKLFRGLVIAIGVNDVEGRPARNNDLMQSIGSFIRGLIGENEFACRAGEAEYLIVCSGIEGAEAQRRLSQIAEQLWDYQLRGASTWSILFSWGGADVRQQPLSEAIAKANEQMYQTRRSRKTVSVESARPWRKLAM